MIAFNAGVSEISDVCGDGWRVSGLVEWEWSCGFERCAIVKVGEQKKWMWE